MSSRVGRITFFALPDILRYQAERGMLPSSKRFELLKTTTLLSMVETLGAGGKLRPNLGFFH
jgi:hypothetical protein